MVSITNDAILDLDLVIYLVIMLTVCFSFFVGEILYFPFLYLKKFLVVLLHCLATEMVDSQYYGYALPSGYVCVYRHSIQPVRMIGYSPHLNYFNYQTSPIYGRSYPPRVAYNYKSSPQRVPISNKLVIPMIIPKQTDESVKLALLSKKSDESASKALPSGNEIDKDADTGFKLLDNLVETVSQAAGTATDSDAAELDAVKSIFADVIDEIIRQVQMKFKENNLDLSISEGFLRKSLNTKKSVSEAPNQTILATILKPYIAELKAFTAKGIQAFRS